MIGWGVAWGAGPEVAESAAGIGEFGAFAIGLFGVALGVLVGLRRLIWPRRPKDRRP